jgi:hypothetical protein
MRLLAFLCLLSAIAHGGEKPKIAITNLSAPDAMDKAVVTAIQDAIASEVANRGYFQVVTAQEIGVLLGMERQKQLLGCAEEGNACLAELSGAMGAQFVMSGSLAPLGDAVQLSLQVQDTQRARAVGRSTKIADDLNALRALIPWAVAEATATPLPAPPSKWLPITLISAGAIGVIGGSAIGALALNQQAVLEAELKRGEQGLGTLSSLSKYQDDQADLGRKKLTGLVALGLGAALVGVGIYLWPNDPQVRASVAMVPTPNGFVLVGVLP